MKIYIITDSDDGRIDSIYDEETFKKVYVNYLGKSKNYWDRAYDVHSYKLNKSYEENGISYISPEDILSQL